MVNLSVSPVFTLQVFLKKTKVSRMKRNQRVGACNVLTYDIIRNPTDADGCRRMPTDADGCRRMPTDTDGHRRTPTDTDGHRRQKADGWICYVSSLELVYKGLRPPEFSQISLEHSLSLTCELSPLLPCFL